MSVIVARALRGVRDRSGRGGAATHAALLCAAVLAVSGCVGLIVHQPWLFPSLGPTVMLLFESPEQPSARPLNTLVGHLVGIAAGWAALVAFGLNGQPPAPVAGLTVGFVAAGAVSVAVTTAVLTGLRLPHPPAGASTLIVSLGILTSPTQIASMVGAVVLVIAAGWVLHRMLGATTTTDRQVRERS